MRSATGGVRAHARTALAIVVAVLVPLAIMPTVAVTPTLASTGACAPAGQTPYLHTCGSQIVDAGGNPVRLRAVNWYGFDSNDFVAGGLRYQSYQAIVDRIKSLGFNAIRLPFSNELVERNPVVSDLGPICVHLTCLPDTGAEALGPNGNLVGLRALDIMQTIVDYAGGQGLYVILDNHRSEAAWGPEENGLWYNRANACLPTTAPYICYTARNWHDDWATMERRFANDAAVIGLDLRNEPHSGRAPSSCGDYLSQAHWGPCGGANNDATDWQQAATQAGNEALGVNPHWLIFVEGVSTYRQPDGSFPNDGWGENLQGAATDPVSLNVGAQLVYAPHDYRFYQQDNNAGDLYRTWDRAFGFVSVPNQPYTAPLWVGEFGTCTHANNCILDRTEPGANNSGFWFSTFAGYMDNGDPNPDPSLPTGTAPIPGGISWSYWPINGTYSDSWSYRNSDQSLQTWQTCYGQREDFGLLGSDWSTDSAPFIQQYLFAPSATPSPSASATALDTATASASATATPSPTPPGMPTATAAVTATATATRTPFSAPTATSMPGATSPATPTMVASAVPSSTPSPTPALGAASGNGGLYAQQTVVPVSGTVTTATVTSIVPLSGTSTAMPSAVSSPITTATLTPTATASPTTTSTPTGTATASPTTTATATASPTTTDTATATSTATNTPAPPGHWSTFACSPYAITPTPSPTTTVTGTTTVVPTSTALPTPLPRAQPHVVHKPARRAVQPKKHVQAPTPFILARGWALKKSVWLDVQVFHDTHNGRRLSGPYYYDDHHKGLYLHLGAWQSALTSCSSRSGTRSATVISRLNSQSKKPRVYNATLLLTMDRRHNVRFSLRLGRTYALTTTLTVSGAPIIACPPPAKAVAQRFRRPAEVVIAEEPPEHLPAFQPGYHVGLTQPAYRPPARSPRRHGR